MDAKSWDERYRSGRMWSVAPNRWVVQELSGTAPGRALDAACGEGRNAIWLAQQGWSVVGVDYSQVALDRARQTHASLEDDDLDLTWIQADITMDRAVQGTYDLVLASYVHLVSYERTPLLRAAASTLAPGGTILVVGHDSTNLTEGYGGPQDASLLYTAKDVADDLQDMISSGVIAVDRADRVAREVETEDGVRVAWDALFRAHRRDMTKGEVSFV